MPSQPTTEATASPSSAPSSTGLALAMDALAFAKLHPREFHRKFVEKGVRPDMRQLLEYRGVHVATGSLRTADASALVRLGSSTKVLCGIKLEVKAPQHNCPASGELDLKVQAWPLCSPTARIGAATDEALRLGRSLHRVLTTNGVLDLEQLCIERGHAVWVLRCDVLVLDDSGNLQDASLLAVVAALRTLRIPACAMVGGDDAAASTGMVELTDGESVPFSLQAVPLSCTFAVLDDLLIVDPTNKEEEVADGFVTITRLSDQRLCSVYKPGGVGLARAQLEHCLQQSNGILKAMHTLLDEYLDKQGSTSDSSSENSGSS